MDCNPMEFHGWIYKCGWLFRDFDETDLQAIEQLDVEQSFFGRLFNFESTVVSGTDVDEIRTPVVANAVQFKATDEAVHRG